MLTLLLLLSCRCDYHCYSKVTASESRSQEVSAWTPDTDTLRSQHVFTGRALYSCNG